MNRPPSNRREQEGVPAKTNATAAQPTKQDRSGARLNRHLRLKIGDQLKAMYDAVLAEPVPERLSKLLEQLAVQESRR